MQRMEHHYLVQPVHEFWRKLPARCLNRGALHLLVQSSDWLVLRLDETIPPCINSVISPPPRFEVKKITVCDKSTGDYRLTSKSLCPTCPAAIATVHRCFFNFIKEQET